MTTEDLARLETRLRSAGATIAVDRKFAALIAERRALRRVGFDAGPGSAADLVHVRAAES